MQLKNVQDKREKEKRTIRLMIEIYCKKHHGQKMCPECQELYDYACMRIDKCPFMESKTFCSFCKVHCYGKQQREKIREVMRFSGPRMLYHHPVLAIKHMILTIKYKRSEKKEKRQEKK